MNYWYFDKAKNELRVGRYDQGKVYICSKEVHTTEQFAFWLRHYSDVHIATFKLDAELQSQLSVEDVFENFYPNTPLKPA